MVEEIKLKLDKILFVFVFVCSFLDMCGDEKDVSNSDKCVIVN